MTDRPTPDVIAEAERVAYEAEMRYARTGLTIDAQRAVDARRAVPGFVAPWRRRSIEQAGGRFVAVNDLTERGAR